MVCATTLTEAIIKPTADARRSLFLLNIKRPSFYSTPINFVSTLGARSAARTKSFYELYSGSATESSVMMTRVEVWLKGLLAAAISGAAGGVLTGLAAVGIEPQHFNLQAGIGATFRIGAAAALINAVIGVAAYLQKSPLPSGD